jgi:acyl dehydratase
VALYLEDLAAGLTFSTRTFTVTAERIRAFAAEYDPQPFHLDETAAQDSVFGALVASGWLTSAVTMRLLVDSEMRIAGGLIGLGGEIAWPKPVRPGDTLKAEVEVLDVRTSVKKPQNGVATARVRTLDQHGESVQIFTVKMLVPRRR